MPTVTVLDPKDVFAVLAELPFPSPRRAASGPEDWGDPASVGLQTKRRGKSYEELNIKTDFGEFLGRHEPFGYCVGVWNPGRGLWSHDATDATAYRSVEAYPTEAAMKAEWVLD